MPALSDRRWTDRADITSLLGAFCFFLSAVEYMIPKPLPFMRLGIANLPILLATELLPLPWFLVLALVKVVGMSVISGSLFSYIALFSLSGTLVAAIVMWTARKVGGRYISTVGVSVLGAVASNGVQILLARVVVFGEAARLIAPPFLAMGLVTGTALGFFAEAFARKSRWYAAASGSAMADSDGRGGPAAEPVGEEVGRAVNNCADAERKTATRALRCARYEELFAPWTLAAAGAAVSVAYLLQPSLLARAGMLAVLMAAVNASGKRISIPATLIVSAGIVSANLLIPVGKVLLRLGPLTITETALRGGIEKALIFEGLVYISKASILPSLRLPGRFGAIVASAFLYYGRIVEYKGKLRPTTLLSDADELMLRVWEEPPAQIIPDRHSGRPLEGSLILAGAVGVAYAMLAIALCWK